MNYNGAQDNRSQKEKLNDFSVLELRASGSVVFEDREPVGYTTRNQNGSNSCVAQTVAKMLEIWDLKDDKNTSVYSATPIYQARLFKAPGMGYVDAFNFTKNKGSFLESDYLSQNISDAVIDATKVDLTKAKLQRPTNYVTVPTDFYAVASEVKRSGAVMVWFKCSYQEWSQDVPQGDSDSEEVRHSVCAVDIISHKGVEYIILEDSWGTWLKESSVPLKAGQRAITKKFFDKHCYFAGAFTTFTYTGGDKPAFTFSKPMKFGERSSDVNKLQKFLIYTKDFPSNQSTTDYFGPITARALVKWQVRSNILDFANEKNLTKIRFGNLSIIEANKQLK